MSLFKMFVPTYWRNNSRQERQNNKNTVKTNNSFENSLIFNDNFSNIYSEPFKDPYLCNAWVNIAVNILIRNIARAD